MVFIFIMQLVRRWYNTILFPVLYTPLFYVLFSLWVGLMISMTYFFLRRIDRGRLHYMQRNMVVSLVKSGLYGLLISTMLLALIGLCLGYMAESDFFIRQRELLISLSMVTMPHIIGFGSTLSGLVILFLITSQYYAIEYLSDISYQLQYSKKWWIYFGLSTCVSLVCYILFVGLS